METLNMSTHFPCAVYVMSKPSFLKDVKEVANRELQKLKVEDKMYPIMQTGSLDDERMQSFATFIAQTAWDILKDQGYAMNNFNTIVTELWAQQFDFRGQHVEHIHNFGAQITGFYFLEVPDNSSYPMLHDPNHAKRQISLPENDINNLTLASTTVNFSQTVKAGDFYFFNSWMPHSFAPNRSTKPFKFIHFNVGVMPAQNHTCDLPENMPEIV